MRTKILCNNRDKMGRIEDENFRIKALDRFQMKEAKKGNWHKEKSRR